MITRQQDIGELIRTFRKREGKTQLELELSADLASGSLSKIESGKVNPSKETLYKIASELGLNSIESAEVLGFDLEIVKEMALISSKILRCKTPKEAIKIACEESKHLFHSTGISVYVVRKDRIEICELTESSPTIWAIKVFKKVMPLESLSFRLKPGSKNILVRALNEKTVMYTSKLSDIISPPFPKRLSGYIQKVIGVKSFIVLPVLVEERLLGGIVVGRQIQVATKYEVEAIKFLAEILAVPLQNIDNFAVNSHPITKTL